MVFDAYAAYYDLLYKDKNYTQEAIYVHQLIQQHCKHAHSILDLGCGTGKHAAEFFNLGYKVTGVDISAKMIRIAEKNYRQDGISFQHGDIRNIRLNKKYDVVVALFHVMCYQTEDHDLLNALETAALHMEDNGLMIFDCWYGPGVINDPPVVRIKTMHNEKIEVERIAQPHLQIDRKIVNVDYQVRVKEKKNDSEYFINEKHKMRYLFSSEITTMAKQIGLQIIGSHEWLKFDALDNKSCWNVAFVLKKI